MQDHLYNNLYMTLTTLITLHMYKLFGEFCVRQACLQKMPFKIILYQTNKQTRIEFINIDILT